MFGKIFMKKAFLFFLFSSFLSLSPMGSGASSSSSTETVQSVFGHRLRLKNYTNTPKVVSVLKAGGEFWSAKVDVHSSIDLGSIHDECESVEIYPFPNDVLSEVEITIPVKEIIKQFQNIPADHMLFCVIDKSFEEYSYRFEEAVCEKNSFNPRSGTPFIYQMFPALRGTDMASGVYGGDPEVFRKSNPLKFYQCILGLNLSFIKQDVIARADRLLEEWSPNFYDELNPIATAQIYIELAKCHLISMLDIEFEQEAFERASESGRFAPSTSRLSQDEEDDLCMRLLPNLLGETQTTFKHSQTFDEQYFVSLLKVVQQGISLYMEQRSFPEGYNQALLSIFKMKQPIIPFQVLHDLIKSFVKKIDEQLYFAPGDEASYIQAESITPENRVNIIGDIHGSIHSLVKIFEDSLKGKTGNTKYVFLGDYTDRGMFGAEVLALLMCFKLANWNNVFMLRGNHECYAMNLDGGAGPVQCLAFKTELEAKYGLENGNKLLLEFNELYKRLPLALYMKTNEEDCVQFCHAGFHPQFNPKEYLSQKQPIQGVRFTNGYNFSHFNGFVWGDFYQRNCKIVQDVSGRGIDPRCLPAIDDVMSSDPAARPIECTGIKAIFRGHQHFGCGLKMFPKIVEKSEEEYETPLGALPMSWYLVVDSDPEGLSRDVDGRFKLKISHYIPIFTFSAATELGVTRETYYGVLQPAEKFEDWTLKPICLG